MKKEIASAVVLALMSAPVAAFAGGSVTCAPTDHPVYDTFTGNVYSCISDAAWKSAMAEQSSRAANHLPVVPVGTVVSDAAGIKYTCLPGFIRYDAGCYDLTHTPQYEAQARLIAEELSGNFGWGYWLNH